MHDTEGTIGQQYNHKQIKPIIEIHQLPTGQRKSTQTSQDGSTSLDNNMKHKAPCSSRGYSGLRESEPLNIEGEGDGDVGEDDGGVDVDCGDDDGPGSVPAPAGERGSLPPFFFFFFFLDG